MFHPLSDDIIKLLNSCTVLAINFVLIVSLEQVRENGGKRGSHSYGIYLVVESALDKNMSFNL